MSEQRRRETDLRPALIETEETSERTGRDRTSTDIDGQRLPTNLGLDALDYTVTQKWAVSGCES